MPRKTKKPKRVEIHSESRAKGILNARKEIERLVGANNPMTSSEWSYYLEIPQVYVGGALNQLATEGILWREKRTIDDENRFYYCLPSRKDELPGIHADSGWNGSIQMHRTRKKQEE